MKYTFSFLFSHFDLPIWLIEIIPAVRENFILCLFSRFLHCLVQCSQIQLMLIISRSLYVKYVYWHKWVGKGTNSVLWGLQACNVFLPWWFPFPIFNCFCISYMSIPFLSFDRYSDSELVCLAFYMLEWTLLITFLLTGLVYGRVFKHIWRFWQGVSSLFAF